MDIEIVSRPSCVYCTKAKEWMRREGISFREVRAGNDGRGVPRLHINGRERMLGWSEPAWREAIMENKRSGIVIVPSAEVSPSAGIKEQIEAFFKTPAPPSELHRAGVTAAGGIVAHLAVTKGAERLTGKELSPAVEAVAGVAAILTGHYALNRWEAKSVGYGMLADAAIRHFVKPRLSASQQSSVSSDAQASGDQRRISERAYLTGIAFSSQSAPSGAIATSEVPWVGQRPTHVMMPDGSLLTIEQYHAAHEDRVRAAIAEGRSQRPVDIANAITEARFLARVREEGKMTGQGISFRGSPDPSAISGIEGLGNTTLPFGEYTARYASRVAAARQAGMAEGEAIRAQSSAAAAAEAARAAAARAAETPIVISDQPATGGSQMDAIRNAKINRTNTWQAPAIMNATLTQDNTPRIQAGPNTMKGTLVGASTGLFGRKVR